MKSVFKIVLNKLRSTFRRSTDQNLDQRHRESSVQDDSEQSSKIKNSRSDSSLSTCSSVLLGNNSKLGDLIENELKKKGCLPRKHQTVIRCSSATCSPRHPVKQYGSNKSTKSGKSLGSTLSNKSVKSVGQLNENVTTSSIASSTNLHYQKRNVSCQNSNDTLSTTSSIALLFNPQISSSVTNKQFDQQNQRINTGSCQSLLRGDSPDNSSSHLSSLADTVPELPLMHLNDDTQSQRNQQEFMKQDTSSYSINDFDSNYGGDLENTISASSPNLHMQQQNRLHQVTPSNQPLLISQSMSMDEPELSDTDSLIAIEFDQTKCRSKSVDASVVIAMKNQSLSSASVSGNQKGIKPRGSATFLEIPKWRLFVRKQSNASTTALNSHANLGGSVAPNNQETNIHSNQMNANQITNQTTVKTVIKLGDIFKDCVHCKLMDVFEPKKIYDSSSIVNNDLLSDTNNNTLTENQSLEEEDEEDFSELSSEEQDECVYTDQMGSNSMSTGFHGNDFSSTAVYHQQQNQHTSSMAKDSGVKRYVKKRRSSYNVTYFSKPTSNLQQQQIARPLSATGFINTNKKPADDKQQPQIQQSDEQSDKQPIFRLPSIALSEASDDEQEKDAMNDLLSAVNVFGNNTETQFISIQITEPSASCCENELDPGSGITVVSLEVPVLNSGKQARSASVDSSFLQVPQRTDIGVTGELPPTKSMRSRSVDIALPEGPDGLYIVVPTGNQRPPTTK